MQNGKNPASRRELEILPEAVFRAEYVLDSLDDIYVLFRLDPLLHFQWLFVATVKLC